MGPVIVRSKRSFRADIDTGTHKLVADEPVSAGGTDLGPTPYDFLSAALGACTSMTLHFLAKRDNIPLEDVEIRVTNDRMYAKDCADCSSKSGYIHRFDVQIVLHGNLTPEQRERLLSAARRCPVNKTLTNEIRVEEKLVDD
jgi:putative redox protein